MKSSSFESGPTVKFCLDCTHYQGTLSPEDREFLMGLLKPRMDRYGSSWHYSVKLILSWVQHGKIRKPGPQQGAVDPEKARAVKILKNKGTCRKENVSVYALDVACVYWRPGGECGPSPR
jgi:hypothetical protein